MNTKDKFIETTSELLETQGYHATGLSQIVEKSGSPRGSMYYHFPGGKEELAESAVQHAGEMFACLIGENLREDIPIADAISDFVQGVAGGVESSGFSSGGPLTAIAMETATTNERLNLACREAYSLIQQSIAQKFLTAGYTEEEANRKSIFVTSAIEGGIILSRTQHSVEPLSIVAENLQKLLRKD
jgi:TetR/AcrR family transcriptional repressor of lmrAB and yxaGH operons